MNNRYIIKKFFGLFNRQSIDRYVNKFILSLFKKIFNHSSRLFVLNQTQNIPFHIANNSFNFFLSFTLSF